MPIAEEMAGATAEAVAEIETRLDIVEEIADEAAEKVEALTNGETGEEERWNSLIMQVEMMRLEIASLQTALSMIQEIPARLALMESTQALLSEAVADQERRTLPETPLPILEALPPVEIAPELENQAASENPAAKEKRYRLL